MYIRALVGTVPAARAGARIGVMVGKGKGGVRAPVGVSVSCMTTRRYVLWNTHGRYHPTYTAYTTVLQERWGTTQQVALDAQRG